MASIIHSRLREYQRGLLIIVAFLSEARIRECAVKQVDFFVEAPEASDNDAAILVRPQTLQTRESAAETWFVELEAHREKIAVAALDIKSFTAKCDSKRGVFFSLKVQAGQRRACQALIVVSPKEPDFVLLIPLHYLPERNQDDAINITSIRPLWTLHPLPAFPAEYTAFVTPVAQLGLRLQNMRAYYNQSSDAWGNEYTGVTFPGVPPPQLDDIAAVEPTIHYAENALGRLRRYFQAFHDYSERFRFDLIGVRPFEVFVELKDGIVDVVRDEESGLQVLGHQAVYQANQRPIFSWKAQWDYLLSAHVGQRYAYFFPRDKIPADWWDQDGTVKMSEGFQAYRIDLRRQEDIVRDMEIVLDRTRAETGSMRARHVRPVRPLTEAGEETGDHLGRGDLGLVGKYRWSTAGWSRGFGSAEHGECRRNTYAQWVSEVLIELCRASGEAMILDFGVRNEECRFAVALYRWSDVDRVRYDQDGEPPARVWNFPHNTPVVPLTLVGMSWTGDWQPWPGRDSIDRLEESKKRPRSLVILDLYPESCLRMRHDRYVFVSEQVRAKLTRGVRGVLREGLLERYAVRSADLIQVMTAPLRGDTEVTLGVPGSTIRARDYCHVIREFHQAGVTAPSSEEARAKRRG
ncbi:hypothetical protein BDR22DRAFT_825007 [Usnea florida]